MKWVSCAELRESHPAPGEFALRSGEIIGLLDDKEVVVTAILERTVVYGPSGDKQLAKLDRVWVRSADVTPIEDNGQSEIRRKQAQVGRKHARVARAQNKTTRIKGATQARLLARRR